MHAHDLFDRNAAVDYQGSLVMNVDLSDDRNRTASAISSGRAYRPKGIIFGALFSLTHSRFR